ncbi:FG-GAP-like repeat-containing protein [Streptomyces roseolus]|uniref:FG-GAP-like repeat-containing protein n=1 Tax=Streptomyces roseolus TaxID=67358 RepID=UPI0037002E6D
MRIGRRVAGWAATGVMAAGLVAAVPTTTAVSAEAPAGTPQVRTITYNVCGADAEVCRSELSLGAWANGVVGHITDWDSDVVMLQEMCKGQYDELRKLLPGYAGVWESNRTAPGCSKWGADQTFGQALLVKGPQSQVTGMSAVVTADVTEPRSVVCAKAPVEGRTVLACSTHLRQDALTHNNTPALMEHIDDWANGLPVILAGDFNAAPHYSHMDPVYAGRPGTLSLVEAGCGDTACRSGVATLVDKDKTKYESKFDYTFFTEQDFRERRSETVETGLTKVKDHLLLRSAASFQDRPAPVGGDLTGDGVRDLLAVHEDGTLRLYAGLGNGRFASSRVIGNSGWSTADVSHRGDWTGDGREDVVARIGNNLWVYPNTGDGRLGARIPMGARPTGWENAEVLAVGDVDGDGQPDLVGRSVNGLYLHRGSVGVNPTLPKNAVVLGGTEWAPAALPEILAPGDVNGDGRADLWARAADGQFRRFLSAGAAALPAPTAIGTADRTAYPLSGTVGDADGDGRADLLLTVAPGDLRFLPGNATGTGFGSPVTIGTGTWGAILGLR